MTLTASPNQTLTAYDESDWANDPDGFILFHDCKETETCYIVVN